VHFDPEAVAGAMAERLTEAARLQRAARRLVDLDRDRPGPTDAIALRRASSTAS